MNPAIEGPAGYLAGPFIYPNSMTASVSQVLT